MFVSWVGSSLPASLGSPSHHFISCSTCRKKCNSESEFHILELFFSVSTVCCETFCKTTNSCFHISVCVQIEGKKEKWHAWVYFRGAGRTFGAFRREPRLAVCPELYTLMLSYAKLMDFTDRPDVLHKEPPGCKVVEVQWQVAIVCMNHNETKLPTSSICFREGRNL